MPAGYSGTPLPDKLGIKPGMKILLLHQPPAYFKWMPSGIADQLCSKNEIPDLIHLFVLNNSEFMHEMKKLEPIIQKNTSVIIWVSWYKKAAGMETDMTEDVIRNYALKHNLVDIKVCAVDEKWSGLKLVVPLKKR